MTKKRFVTNDPCLAFAYWLAWMSVACFAPCVLVRVEPVVLVAGAIFALLALQMFLLAFCIRLWD